MKNTELKKNIIVAQDKLYLSVQNFMSQKLCRCFPMEGSSYASCKTRLMVIGRSVNGWTELEETKGDYLKACANELETSGFSWLDDEGIGIEPYKNAKGELCYYNTNKSAFWRTIKNILVNLVGIENSEGRWFENIVWYNICPIAPLSGGNADGRLKMAQISPAKALLKEYIEYYNPTHILFISDWDWWFETIKDVFPNVHKVGESKTDNVVGKGFYNDIPVVVSVRPDRTIPNKPNEAVFSEDIIKTFKGGITVNA